MYGGETLLASFWKGGFYKLQAWWWELQFLEESNRQPLDSWSTQQLSELFILMSSSLSPWL